jgi:hypothetical protein
MDDFDARVVPKGPPVALIAVGVVIAFLVLVGAVVGIYIATR